MIATFSVFFLVAFLTRAENVSESEAEEVSYWEKAKKTLDEIKTGDRDITEDTKNWVIDDVKRIGDWQYRVIKVKASDPDAIEKELNALGEERWECFFVERVDEHLMFYFKKSKISYLHKVSQGSLGKLIGDGDK
ncbi:hypothetical protein [Rubellicoccus peritrichatus]|uniref:Uncharacterized protein n=1 Tax=Rubellicoccus peritrichatus TaxID=3080537 RepID=A0AAQ3L8I7_9BACT|nr:hypothetical protein [Puniceicoccus sp. CR14]WOO39637.1 hypothetical protein RZN69_13520 [Puniceicoccus sp. CR14]